MSIKSSTILLFLVLFATKLFSQTESTRSFEGHQYTVFSLDINGNYLATASWDRTLKLWNLETGEQIRTFSGHTQPLLSVRFSKDGKYLASCGKDQVIKIWNVSNATIEKNLYGHTSWVYGCCFSPDGKNLASCSEDKTLKIWDLRTGKTIHTLMGHSEEIRKVVYSPNGKLLASCSKDKTIKIWDATNGKLIRTLIGHTEEIWSIDFSPNGKFLVSGSRDMTVRKWNVSTGEQILKLNEPTGWVNSVQFSPDGAVILSSAHEQFSLWNANNGKYLKAFREGAGAIYEARFSQKGDYIASTYKQSALWWDVKKLVSSVSIAFVKWNFPKTNNYESHTKKINIENYIKSDSTLDEVAVYLNDSLVLRKSNFKPKLYNDSLTNFTNEIELKAGTNKLTIKALNGAGEISYEKNVIYPLYLPLKKTKQKRIAFFIENTDYQYLGKLKNDNLNLLHEILRKKGFSVFVAKNKTTKDLNEIFNELIRISKEYEPIVIYYSGFSTNSLINNDLVGVNDSISISLNACLNQMESTKQKVLIFDTQTNKSTTNSSTFKMPPQTLLVYSDSNFGSFTNEFLKIVEDKKEPFTKLLQKIRKNLDQQTILEINTLKEDFYFDEL